MKTFFATLIGILLLGVIFIKGIRVEDFLILFIFAIFIATLASKTVDIIEEGIKDAKHDNQINKTFTYDKKIEDK